MKLQDHLSTDFIDQLYRKVIQNQKKYSCHHLSKEQMDVNKLRYIEQLMDRNKQVHQRHNGAIRNKR